MDRAFFSPDSKEFTSAVTEKQYMLLVMPSADYVHAVVATNIYGGIPGILDDFLAFYAILPSLSYYTHPIAQTAFCLNLVNMTSRRGLCPSDRST